LAFGVDVFMRYPNYRGMVFSDQDPTLRFHVTPLPAYANSNYALVSTLYDASGNILEGPTSTSLGGLPPPIPTAASPASTSRSTTAVRRSADSWTMRPQSRNSSS